jgi:hypothetical protein
MYDVTTASVGEGSAGARETIGVLCELARTLIGLRRGKMVGGMGSLRWGKLSVRSNSRQWREIRVVRYKWRVACRTKPGWVTVQNRLIYLSHINSVSIFFFFYGPRFCHPILRPTAACEIGHILTATRIDHQSWISLAINNLNYCKKIYLYLSTATVWKRSVIYITRIYRQ